MAMYSIRLDGDTRAMLRRIRSFSEIDKQGINAALAEGARESTLERFKQSKGPDGRRWKTSIRAAQEGGKTLIQSAQLRNSIHAKSDTSGFALGTNVKYAATHQFGEPGRTIRARKKKALRFQVGGKWVTFEQDRADVGLLALLQSLLCGKRLGLDARRFQLVDEILLAFRVEQEINPPSG